MRVSIIVAMALNGVIGRAGTLPWHLGDDLKRFKQLTTGHTVVMGRKTWESIGRPLPGRRNIVITRQTSYRAEGAEVVGSLDQAIAVAAAAGESELFVIGGAEIYRLAVTRADRKYVTLVAANLEGDTFFPGAFGDDLVDSKWESVDSGRHDADANNDYAFRTYVFDRREPTFGGPFKEL
jgi:dihydrofolate reductase